MVTTRGRKLVNSTRPQNLPPEPVLEADSREWTTRGKTLINPTRPENWPPEPVSEADFQEWIEQTKTALMKWLREAKERAMDESIRNQVNRYTRESDSRWQRHGNRTDVKTGTIFDDALNKKMTAAVKKETEDREKLHSDQETWPRYVEYLHAQMAWEDHLYYQNVWNRKDLEPGMEYEETNHKKKIIRGTTGQKSLTRKNKFPNGYFGTFYSTWIEHMIQLYQRFRLGYRKRIPAVVSPDIAHRYSQSVRGTTKQDLPKFRRRYKRLEERYPRKRRPEIDVHEVEEHRRKRIERQRDHELDRKKKMQTITWRMDEKAYETQRTRIESKSGYATNPLTLRLLPKDHVSHHGSLETSFNWPTSFDSPKWGNCIAQTSYKRKYLYEQVSDSDSDSADQQTARGERRKPKPFKTNENGDFIKKVDRAPRYKKEIILQSRREFENEMMEDGETVRFRDRGGAWPGKWVEKDIATEYTELDAQGKRIPLSPRYLSKTEFSVTTRVMPKIETRPGRHKKAGADNQLSDTEDEDCVNSNPNWKNSGNMNSDQLGGDRAGSDEETNGEDEESDHEGDLFAQSYKECSGTGECPDRRRARELVERLTHQIGENPMSTVDIVVDLFKRGIKEDVIEREWYIQVEPDSEEDEDFEADVLRFIS